MTRFLCLLIYEKLQTNTDHNKEQSILTQKTNVFFISKTTDTTPCLIAGMKTLPTERRSHNLGNDLMPCCHLWQVK